MTVRVAVIQLDCSSSEPVAQRITRTLKKVESAAKDAELIVLPELWHVGAFDVVAAGEHAQPIDGPLVTAMAALAKEHRIWLHGGSISELADDGNHYNTSVLFAPDGVLVASYRKIHLFGFDGGETVLMSSGDELVVADTPLGPTGLATCYDLRFPELFRALTEGQATAVLLASGWPTPRIEHWDVLTRARAIENQAWVVACNEVGEQPGVTLGGHSVIVESARRRRREGGGVRRGAVRRDRSERGDDAGESISQCSPTSDCVRKCGGRNHPPAAERRRLHAVDVVDGAHHDHRVSVRVQPPQHVAHRRLGDRDAAGRGPAVGDVQEDPAARLGVRRVRRSANSM